MKIEASVLRQLSIDGLEGKVKEIKAELSHLRQKKNNGDVGPNDIRAVKKNLARALTIRREKIYTEAIGMYSAQKSTRKYPKELRPKLTKAKRQKFSLSLLKRRTWKQRMRPKSHNIVFSYDG